MNVNSSATTLTFIAPSLPNGVFTGTVVVMVMVVNRFGRGPAGAATAEIRSTYVRMLLHNDNMHDYVYIICTV